MFFKKFKKTPTSSELFAKAKRVFSFGCSFVSYRWPTWADIIGEQFSHYENWGKGGSGIQYTFNSIMECDQRNRLTKDDLVIIGWTLFPRLDWYRNGEWDCNQSVVYEETDGFMPNRLDDYPCSSFKGYEILGAAHIQATHHYLKSKGIPFIAVRAEHYNLDSPVLQLYKPAIDEIRHISIIQNQNLIPSDSNFEIFFKPLYNRLAGPSWPSLNDIHSGNYKVDPIMQQEIDHFKELASQNRLFKLAQQGYPDPHALPNEHLRLVRTYWPELEINKNTVKWINQTNAEILSPEGFEYINKKIPPNRF